MMSNSCADWTAFFIRWRMHACGSSKVRSRQMAFGQVETNFPDVCEAPEAKSVTSCPRLISFSVRRETIYSVPPWVMGGTGTHRGAICAMRITITEVNHTHSLSYHRFSKENAQHYAGCWVLRMLRRRRFKSWYRWRVVNCGSSTYARVRSFGGLHIVSAGNCIRVRSTMVPSGNLLK